MPNFDRFERLLRVAMEAQDPSPFIPDLVNLPNENRPRLFKDRSSTDIRDWLLRAHSSIRSYFDQPVILSTSDVNVTGSDLLETPTNTHIELKTGKVTDANIGLSTLAWALEDTSDKLFEILRDSMIERRSLALEDNYAAIAMSQHNTMKRLEHYFSSRVVVGNKAPRRLEHFARCVARGVTTQRTAQDLLGRKEQDWHVPLILHADWTRGWKLVSNPFYPDEHLLVKSMSSGMRAHLRAPDPTDPVIRLATMAGPTIGGSSVSMY